MQGTPFIPKRCYLCGKPIVGTYYTDWAGHCVCASHKSTLTQCVSCSQFCDRHAKSIGRGKMVCTHCQKNRIDHEEAKKIVQYIQNLYSKTPIGRIEGWRLKMGSADAMFRLGKDDKAQGYAQDGGNEYTIYILRDVSRVEFARVLAHEMLHVYQFIRHISPARAKCEGFCNLGSYYVLSSIKNPEAKAAIERFMQDSSPIYGTGFRDMLVYYKRGGWNAAIKHLKE